MRMFFHLPPLALALALALPVRAEPVDGSAARKMLFSTRGFVVAPAANSGLGRGELGIVEALLSQDVPGFEPRYYGAVAVSPDFFGAFARDPAVAALSGLLQMSFNFHDAASAAGAALAACEAARKPGAARCVVAAHVLPRGWSPRPVQLSAAATDGFRAYRRGSGPKAFAVSPGTGEYAIVKGEGAAGAALAACNRAAAAKNRADCEIVIAD